MRKRLFGIGGALLLLFLALPGGTASAHVLKVDGHIGAVLHINPDDNPTTGSSTDYVVSFSDDTGRFSLAKCDCTVSIVRAGRTITTKPLAKDSSEVSENHYTFTVPAVYTMRLTGTPRTPGAFQPFTLNYEVRVAGGQAAMRPMPVLLWVGMGMTVGLILLASYVMNYTDDERIRRDGPWERR